MRVLTVICHPDPGSFTHAIASAFRQGAEAVGHSVDVADLHAEGFDPRWTLADHAGEVGPDIEAEQQRISQCDALCLVFPLYWYAMPAMMKGWIDRVWSYGWAYEQIGDPTKSLLPARPCVLLIPAGANPEDWVKDGIDHAMSTIWARGTLGYFGFPNPQIEFLGGAEGSAPRRAGLLARAKVIGEGLDLPRGKS